MTAIHTSSAPEPIGPYSQGYIAGGFIYTSMQLPVDPENPERAYGDIKEEARQLIDNVMAVVRGGGGSLYSIAKVTVYVTDLNDFTAVNDVYAELFGHHKPARSVVNVQAIPKGYRVAMEAVATIEETE